MQSTCEKAVVVEQYPRTTIVLTIQEMQDRGNVCIKDIYYLINNFFHGPIYDLYK